MTTKIGSPSRVQDTKQEQINRDFYHAFLNLVAQVNALPAVSGVVSADLIWDAVGDLAVGAGSNSSSRLAVGDDGQSLIADSSEALGVKWGYPTDPYTATLDYVGAGVSYAGKSLAGSATSDAVWQIKKIVETAGDATVTFADGNTNFDNIWDNRASLSYS